MDRWVDFAGLFNFRDVGALTGRPGVIYRSDALCSLVDDDRPRYEALGVQTVIDLRRAEEIEIQGRAPSWSYRQWHNLTVRETTWPVGECADAEAVAVYLADVYLQMNPADIASVLTLLAEPDIGPAVIHCAGGRDRTGVVVALLLSLVGVPDEEIGADYTLTEQFTQRWLKWRFDTTGETIELPPNILHTPPGAILLYLTRLRERHGSVQAFLSLDSATVSALRSIVVA
ncbi:MAG TPA: hypothetical protein DGT23_05445 [Micromonosporaceae bacterium]|nr:hypothetical protein [Micromonosporaceae bacterium]